MGSTIQALPSARSAEHSPPPRSSRTCPDTNHTTSINSPGPSLAAPPSSRPSRISVVGRTLQLVLTGGEERDSDCSVKGVPAGGTLNLNLTADATVGIPIGILQLHLQVLKFLGEIPPISQVITLDTGSVHCVYIRQYTLCIHSATVSIHSATVRAEPRHTISPLHESVLKRIHVAAG